MDYENLVPNTTLELICRGIAVAVKAPPLKGGEKVAAVAMVTLMHGEKPLTKPIEWNYYCDPRLEHYRALVSDLRHQLQEAQIEISKYQSTLSRKEAHIAQLTQKITEILSSLDKQHPSYNAQCNKLLSVIAAMTLPMLQLTDAQSGRTLLEHARSLELHELVAAMEARLEVCTNVVVR